MTEVIGQYGVVAAILAMIIAAVMAGAMIYVISNKLELPLDSQKISIALVVGLVLVKVVGPLASIAIVVTGILIIMAFKTAQRLYYS